VKEILVDEDTIKIKHLIPFTRSSTPGESKVGPKLPGYLLRSGSHHSGWRRGHCAQIEIRESNPENWPQIHDRSYRKEPRISFQINR